MGQQEGDELDRELADAEIAGDEGGFDDDEMMDKMSSSPSIADEDIDFEMVYALHHFSATVEGQANAAKGEHMVLLDDSNSYWWLVRIVRDSSIGYLPAEHIETPTERLARLNKHRNIDLAANMLSDSVHEKSRNPLRKAMRRRNAKTVAFTDPIYHEASEYDYTTEEEEEGMEGGYLDDDEGTEESKEGEAEKAAGKKEGAAEDKPAKSVVSVVNPPAGDPRTSSEMKKNEEGVKLRANPTPSHLRHPDSAIFHDESQGTKKLTLTPGLLRDEAAAHPTKPEVIKGGRGSMDREKQHQQSKREESVISPPPNAKDTKRIKKGGSVLGNLFKKRNKKGKKEEDDEVEEWLHGSEKLQEKQSIDSNRSIDSTPKESPSGRGEESRKEREDAQLREEQKRQQERQRQQKEREQREREAQQQQQQKKAQQVAAVTSTSIRRVESETKDGQSPASKQQLESITSPIDSRNLPDALRVERPEQAQSRSSPVVTPVDTQSTEPRSQSQQRKLSEDIYSPQIYRPAHANNQERTTERLSESPEQITFHDAAERPDLADSSSGAESGGPPSPINSTPEMIDRSSTFDTTVTSPGTNNTTPAPDHLLGGHTMTRTWSDWSLRTYFEDDNDVRDMLIVVQQDKGDVVQQKQHPEIAPIFADSSRRLADITRQLDGMLGEWLQRRGTRA
ncbi:hypothetical protein K440DRAFT_649252 [Wilcoxina mikolae CBS 423.85]|nr:hypothetical protein K440DRAFT_649252 [Wilcoxina mikolae CBS 423.85]